MYRRHRSPEVDGARDGALIVPHEAVAHGRRQQLLHQHVQVLGGAERTSLGLGFGLG